MDLETMFKCNDIFTIRNLFDKYMNKYPSIELYMDYYRMLECKIVNGSTISNLYEYIVDYLFHDSKRLCKFMWNIKVYGYLS